MNTRRLRFLFFTVVATALCCPVIGSAADTAAAGASVQCNDGTTSTHTGRGACSHHGGVKKAGATTPSTEPSAVPPAPAPTTAPTPPSNSAPAPTPAPPPASTRAQTSSKATAPGGGP